MANLCELEIVQFTQRGSGEGLLSLMKNMPSVAPADCNRGDTALTMAVVFRARFLVGGGFTQESGF